MYLRQMRRARCKCERVATTAPYSFARGHIFKCKLTPAMHTPKQAHNSPNCRSVHICKPRCSFQHCLHQRFEHALGQCSTRFPDLDANIIRAPKKFRVTHFSYLSGSSRPLGWRCDMLSRGRHCQRRRLAVVRFAGSFAFHILARVFCGVELGHSKNLLLVVRQQQVEDQRQNDTQAAQSQVEMMNCETMNIFL